MPMTQLLNQSKIPFRTIKSLRRHVCYLSMYHDIGRKYITDDTVAHASIKDKCIHYKEIDNYTKYFIALHEMGHIVLKHNRDKYRFKLYCEAEAWKWAIENSIVKTTAPVRQFMARCLMSYFCKKLFYLEDFIDKRLPHRKHYFWKMLGVSKEKCKQAYNKKKYIDEKSKGVYIPGLYQLYFPYKKKVKNEGPINSECNQGTEKSQTGSGTIGYNDSKSSSRRWWMQWLPI